MVLMAATVDHGDVWFNAETSNSGWLFPLQALAWTVWMVWLERRKKSSTARARSTKMWWDHQPASSTTHTHTHFTALLWTLCQLSCHLHKLTKNNNLALL